MDTSTISALSNALDFGSARVQALSNNLSNVSTPGFKRQDVSFQAMLDAAQGDDGAALALQTTDPRHLSLADEEGRSGPVLVTDSSTSMRPDGNNVDVDAEGARLASAQIYYMGAAQMMQGQFAALKYAISGGR